MKINIIPNEIVPLKAICEKNQTASEEFEYLESLQEETNEEEEPESDLPEVSDLMLKSPKIPKEVYGLLPRILREGSKMFSTARERDVFITSALTILSGIFPTISGIYDSKKVYSNLYSFIIAPAASGKSALIGAKDLAQSIHNKLLSQAAEASSLILDPGRNSELKLLYLPGNISSAALISLLADNHGIGIICEAEADSMSNSLKQDWGGFSDALRKAFHHEHISYARKIGNQFIEVNHPRLSVCLSGTPNQVPALIKSIHDGLFSRFIFYIFRSNPRWKDVSPQKDRPIYDLYMASLQDDIKTIYEFYKDIELSFDLAVFDWLKLNEMYSKHLRDAVTFTDPETSSIVMRMGLIHFRIAMVLSILRHYEKRDTGNLIGCSGLDFSIAEILCEVYLKHSLLVFKIMSKQHNSGLDGNIEKFFNALPIIPFRRKEAGLIGEQLKISERTVSNYLKRLLESKYLVKDKPQGLYQRVPDE